jgi:hypothetical protein
MGAWGSGAWENDTALDYAGGMMDCLIGEINTYLESGYDQDALCRIDLLLALSTRAGINIHDLTREHVNEWSDILSGAAREWRRPDERLEAIATLLTELRDHLDDDDDSDPGVSPGPQRSTQA